MDKFLKTIHELTDIVGPSGRESKVADYLKKNWNEYGEVKEDRLGNLSITIGNKGPHIAFSAHMDEVGFVIKYIDEKGFISLNKLGGIPERVLSGQKILILGNKGLIQGVFTTWPHHLTPESEKYKVKPIGECWVDVGVFSKKEAESIGLRVGDFGVYSRSWHVEGKTIFSNSLDNRAGIASISQLLENVSKNNNFKLSLIASVQEEFCVRALTPTVRELNPDVHVIIDISPATDNPEMQGYSDIKIGHGPTLHLHSFHGRGTLGGVLPPSWLVNYIEDCAQKIEIPIQRSSVVGVITDGAFTQHLNYGIPTVEVGFPVRYTHCPIEVCSLNDLKDLVNLINKISKDFYNFYSKQSFE